MKNLVIAFILNLFFSILEFFGGIFSGSTAIISDALHDFGDALTIGISLLLEKKSKKPADEIYNLGYGRFSLLGGFITCSVLLLGSFFAFFNGINRFFNPREIDVDLTLIFSILGFLINLSATFFAHSGHSHNHKAVTLHLLEDVLGWLIVFLGAIIMKLFSLTFIDPLLSIIISVCIFLSALKELKEIFAFFLLRCPVDYNEVQNSLKNFNVSDLKIFAIDEFNICAYLQTYDCNKDLKPLIKETLKSYGITCVIIENKGYYSNFKHS